MDGHCFVTGGKACSVIVSRFGAFFSSYGDDDFGEMS